MELARKFFNSVPVTTGGELRPVSLVSTLMAATALGELDVFSGTFFSGNTTVIKYTLHKNYEIHNYA